MTALLTTHPNADFDGVASMVAARHLYPGAVLAFSGSAEASVRNFLERHPQLAILNPKQVDLDTIDTVVLCDSNTPERAGHFAERAKNGPFHVFDHHPVDADDPVPDFFLIEPVGATTTLMAERLQAKNIRPAPWEATLMALGIYEETGSLTYASTTPRDLAAAAWLLENGADLEVVRTHLANELDIEQLSLLDSLAHQLDIRYLDGYKVAVATAYTERYVPDVAGVASRLLAIEPMDALIVLIAMGDKVLLVARGTRREIPLGEVAARFGGGGHPTAASAMIREKTVIECVDQVWHALDQQIAPLRTASDLMTPRPVTVDHTASLADVEATLTRYGVNTVPVMDGDRLVGIVSREAVQKGLFHGMATLATTEVMEAEPYTVAPDTPLRDVQEQMVTRNLRFVPVLAPQHNRLLGCITRTDLLRAMHDDLRPVPGRVAQSGERHRTVLDHMRKQLPEPVFQLLAEIGEAGKRRHMGIYMAGGVVRDLLLEVDNLDLDLVVEGDAIAFATEWARQAGGRVHTHERFGTATVTLERDDLPPHFKVDFATARTEFYAAPAALPTVEHSSLKKDLYRRDFTINALAVALHPPHMGMLIDYFGGQRDLKEGRIRVLHTLSFTEDPTRALRAVRFATRYGFTIGAQTDRLIRSAAKLGLYGKLSGKRLRTELIYLLSEANPVAGLTTLAKLDILAGIDPHFAGLADMEARLGRVSEAIAWYTLQFVEPPLQTWQVYLLALGGMLPTEARAGFWQRLAIDGRLLQVWERWESLPEKAAATLDQDPARHRLAVYQTLHPAPPEVLVHLMAVTESDWVKQSVSLYLSQIADTEIALKGDDLAELGYPPGPRYGEILKHLLWARIEGEVATREDEIAWVRRSYPLR